jgi:tyrosine-protein kinase Etk/Wzc
MSSERGVPQKNEARLDIREILRACGRQRLLSLGVPAVVLASTALFLWWAAPVYEGVATIRIDQERSGVAIIEALRNLSSGSKITTEMEELRSRTLAEAVVDSLGLSLGVAQPRKVSRATLLDQVRVARTAPRGKYVLERVGDRAFRVSGEGRAPVQVVVGEPVTVHGATFVLTPAAREHDRIVLDVIPFPDAVRQFQAKLSVSRPNREADLIRVSYQGKDARQVQVVPNMLAAAFIAQRNSVRTREARSTGDFLASQIASLHGQLTATEEELRTFQERFGVLGIEAQSEAAVRRLAEMQADRERLNVERQAVANVIGRLESGSDDPLEPSAYRALLGLPSILTNAAAAELVNALNQAESRRAELLDRRTTEDSEVRLATFQIRQIERQLSTIALTYLASLTEHVNGLDRTLSGFTDQLNRIPEQELHLARLRRQAGVTEELYTALQLRLKEAEIMAAIDDPTVRVIDPSAFPRKPVRPNVPLSVALALMAGMVLGVGSAVAREQMDDTVHSRDELQLVGRVPVLGAIPRLEQVQAEGRGRSLIRRQPALTNGRAGPRLLDSLSVPGIGEAYRSLRTNITFSRLDEAPRTLVVTSPAPGDGKSTTAANLAITMAQQGLRVLLIDADMRRGRLHDSFGVRREPGLSNVLRGQTGLDTAVHHDPGQPDRPALLTTGTVPPNPAELLGSDRMAELLAVALASHDLVIMDAPPLNMVTDAAVLGRHADGVLVVARAGVTQQGALAYTFEQLAAVKAPVLGSILNDADPQRERHYGSYMDGYYEPHD